MNQVVKQDVQEIVPPNKKPEGVEPDGGKVDDKDKNFAELRKQVEEKDAEIARLKAEKATPAQPDAFDLGDVPEDKKGDAGTLQKIFKRDMKEAILQWSSSNKVTPEQWAQIKKGVRLNGEETLSEIKNAIETAYQNLPDVRAKRDQELIEKGKKQAMTDHFDDEIGIPGGGHGGGGGGNGGGPTRIPKETKVWGNKLGLTDKEIESVDPEADSNEYTILDPAYRDK